MKYLYAGILLCSFLCLAIAQDSGGCGNCAFPFFFMGRIQNRCTTIDGDKPWCGTEDGDWEYCSDPSCPGMAANPAEVITPHPLNVANPGVCYCGLPNRGLTSSRIVGGFEAENGEYPWQVALLKGGPELSRQNCGGTLVGSKYVITAAHCTEGLSTGDLMVRVGDTNLAEEFEAESFTFGVASITNHPYYDKFTVENDIAVIELNTSVPLDKYPHIKPACLPDAGATFLGEAVVTGWGTLRSWGNSPTWLNEVDVTVFPDEDCGKWKDADITEDMICAGVKEGGKAHCSGDSGGPLVASDPGRNKAMSLIGVVSYSHRYAGCAHPDYPGVYAEVSHFTTWLNQQMPDLITCPAPPSTPPSNSTVTPPSTQPSNSTMTPPSTPPSNSTMTPPSTPPSNSTMTPPSTQPSNSTMTPPSNSTMTPPSTPPYSIYYIYHIVYTTDLLCSGNPRNENKIFFVIIKRMILTRSHFKVTLYLKLYALAPIHLDPSRIFY